MKIPKPSPVAPVATAFNKARKSPLLTAPLGLFALVREKPTAPDVRSGERVPPPTSASDAMSPKRLARLNQKVAGQAGQLARGLQAPPGRQSLLMTARENDGNCAAAIDAIFPTSDPAAPSLGRRLLADFADVAKDASGCREAALLIALGLRQTVGSDRTRASAAWLAIAEDRAPHGLPLATRRDVNDTLRALARSDAAYDALSALKQHRAHAVAREGNVEEFKFGLQATDQLLAMGVDLGPDSAHGIEDFFEHAQSRSAESPKLGTTEDGDVLACRTLLCVRHDLAATGTKASSSELSAYVAWRNGFRESGPGSDFNQAVHAMHKFTTWALRAQPKSGSTWQSVKEFVRGITDAVAHRKMSPLKATRHGTVGAELGELHQTKAAFERALRSAQSALHEGLQAEVDALADTADMRPDDQRRRDALVVMQAVLEAWGRIGRKNIRLDRPTRESIRTRLADAGHAVPAAVLSRLCGQRLTLSTLERWAGEVLAPASPQLALVKASVGDARSVARSEAARTSARPTSQELRDILLLALDTEGVQFRHERDRGVQAGLVVSVPTPAVDVGVNVGPVGSHARGRQATVRIGTTTIGSDIFIGTERRKTTTAGVAATAGIDVTRLDNGVLSGGVGVIGRGNWDDSEGTGVSIRVSKNVKDHKKLARDVIDLLMQGADARKMGHAIDPSELWVWFSNRFLNQPEVAVDFVKTRSARTGASAGIGGGMRLGVSPFTIGPFLSAGVEWSSTRSRRDETGHATSNTAAHETGTTALAQATLAGTAVAQLSIADGYKARFPAVAGLSTARMDFNLGSEIGQVRLTVENGRVQPKLSLAQRQFRTESDFLSYVESARNAWEGCLSGGKAALDGFAQDVRRLPADKPGGNRIYQERRCLTPAAAHELSVLLAQREMIEPLVDAALEKAHLDAELARVAAVPGSWVPEKLAVSEVATSYTEHGLSLLGMIRSRLSATSTNRYLVQLKPDA